MSIAWGILGTGHIATKFVEDLGRIPQARVAAVGSRSGERAEAFGEAHGIPNRHGSYAGLAADAEVDVVYVASPHSEHCAHATQMMEGGKAVLCEKPMALNATQADRMIETARAQDVFLMEAVWTRFLPVMADVHRCLDAGTLGDVQIVRADIGTAWEVDPQHRLFNPDLGGGALLDLGFYPITLALDVLGAPDGWTSRATLGPTGVDEQCGGVLQYASGAQAVWHASLRADVGRTCAIAGPEGRLQGERNWWKGAPFHLTRADGTTDTFARPFEGHGYQFEAMHVMECLREGRTESPVLPLSRSRTLLSITDALRAQWGVRYPGEEGMRDAE